MINSQRIQWLQEKGRNLWKSENFWFCLGLFLAILWADRIRFIPERLSGKFGDANEYYWMATKVQQYSDIYKVKNVRFYAYPGYLKLTQEIYSWIPFTIMSWKNFYSLLTLLIYALSARYFYRSIVLTGLRVPKFALCILVAHPGLISYSFLTMADTPVVSLLLFGLGGLCRLAAAQKKNIFLVSAFTGLAFAFALLFKTSLHFVLAGTLFMFVLRMLWLSLARQLSWGKMTGSLLLILVGFAIPLYQPVSTCTSSKGTLCLTPTGTLKRNVAWSVNAGLHSARMYTQSSSTRQVFHSDSFMKRRFGDVCGIFEDNIASGIFSCLLEQPLASMVFLGKKLVGIFDNYHVSCYAEGATGSFDKFFNRSIGMWSFIGWILVAVFTLALLFGKGPFSGALLPVSLFCLAHIFIHLAMHIEARYSFPGVPLALLVAFSFVSSLANTAKSVPKAIGYGCILLLATVFIVQTSTWDHIMPKRVKHISMSYNKKLMRDRNGKGRMFHIPKN